MREWSDSDRAPYAELNGDPEVMEHFPSTLTAQQSDEMIDRMTAYWDQNDFGLWAVERTDTGALIGFVGLMMPAWQAEFTPCVEVGWRLAFSHWGNGFATEGARAAIEFGFAAGGLDEIVSLTVPANQRSVAVMTRLGMTYAGPFDHPKFPVGHRLRRHVLYRLTRP